MWENADVAAPAAASFTESWIRQSGLSLFGPSQLMTDPPGSR